MSSLSLRGYSPHRGRFLLQTSLSHNSNDLCSTSLERDRIIEREIVDLQHWDRQLHSNIGSSFQRLPTKRLRKLMTIHWVRCDLAAGWRKELQKNVRVCEDWINAAFAQLPTPHQIEFVDDDLYAATKRQRSIARAATKNARDLQQYFSSAELVELVVHMAMMHLQTKQVTDVVWLEPSCGDGRFLTALLRAGAQHVVGYEIDKRLHDLARNSVQQVAKEVAEVNEDSKIKAQVHAGDFLVSESSISKENFVVAIGNPPFGAKGGDGSDLVHNFYRHSASAWRARVVAFIVPERCSRPSFVSATLRMLQDGEKEDIVWTLVKELPLNDFSFEFGTGNSAKRVRQPSNLQLFACSTL
ncbi:hypothetical protein CCR75_005473 [Bremia lactucae]|uniref:DNA methylase adenine-specific domain-containing protein n=1 Tax=Bremia lactucae TaxID=4779 RepID=A0A976FJ80_BRELC|nr:hypothetical protein CCR75_005473 [Bremia lactucae]